MNLKLLLKKLEQHLDISMELISKGDYTGAYEFINGTKMGLRKIELDVYRVLDDTADAKGLIEENMLLKESLDEKNWKLNKLLKENDEKSQKLEEKEQELICREKDLKRLEDKAKKKEREYKTKLLEDSIARHKAM